MKGSVNQEPIMVEVKPKDQEKRFVWTPTTESDKSKSSSETSSSDKEASGRGRRKIAQIAIGKEDAPEFVQRRPSPYAFAQDPPKPGNRHSGEYLLSPESIVSPKTSSRVETLADYGKSASKTTTSTPGISRSVSTNQSSPRPTDRLDSKHTVDGNSSKTGDSKRLREKVNSSQYSFTKAELDQKEPKVKFSEGEDSGSQTLQFDPRDKPSSIRRVTDTATTLPQPTFNIKNSKPSSLQTPLTHDLEVKNPRPNHIQTSFADDLDEELRRKSSERRDSLYGPGVKRQENREASSAASRGAPLTPPETPRRHAPNRLGDSPTRQSHSRPGSGNSSANNSRPSSPVPTIRDDKVSTSVPKQHTSSSDRNQTYPPTSKDRPKTHARPSSCLRSDSLPPIGSTDTGVPPKKSSKLSIVLPYPDDNVSIMPNHEDHIYSPSLSKTSTYPPLPRSRSPTLPSDTSDVSHSSKDSSARPRVQPRHHTLAELPQSKDPSRRSTSDNTQKSSPAEKSQLPPCPRADYTHKHSDWYTLEHCQDIDVCPDCLENVFLPSKYGRFFKRAPSKRAGKPRKCNFSSPWMRLAWLLSLTEKRDNLDLFVALSDVEADERPCPGDEEEKRSWYSVREDSGDHVMGFSACSHCVSNVEALLPSLRGSFTRVNQSEPRMPRKCDLRPKNKQFASYLDTLVDIDTRARFERRIPDLRPFISLIKKSNPEPLSTCSKDNLLVAQRWYFIPQLPELTVCEPCYEAVVYPAIRDRYLIADKFNPKMEPVRESSLGTSCQLYSPRMKDIWRRAIERDDWALLAREAKDRKATEMHLQAKHRALRTEGMKKRSQGVQSKEESYRLDRELEKIAEEWRRWE